MLLSLEHLRCLVFHKSWKCYKVYYIIYIVPEVFILLCYIIYVLEFFEYFIGLSWNNLNLIKIPSIIF